MKNFISKIKLRFASLPTEKRKMYTRLAFLGVFCVFLYVAWGIKNDDPALQKQKQERARTDFILPSVDMAKLSWLEQGQQRLDASEREMKDLRNQLSQIQSKLDQALEAKSTGSKPTTPASSYPTDKSKDRTAALHQEFKRLGVTPVEQSGDLFPASPVKPATQADPKLKGDASPGQPMNPAPVTAPRPGGQKGGRTQAPGTMNPPAIMQVIDYSSSSDTQPLGDEASVATTAADKTADSSQGGKENFYTPSGSFFKVYLLTGLDAPAGPSSSSKPHPVLLRIQDLSWLPNEVRQNVTGCFVSGEAYGELSVERAYIRGVTLSCVNTDNKTVLDEPILGYVADTDGKLGMRGRVVSKQGQYLARGLVAAFIEGVSKGFDTSVNTTVVTGGGVVTTNEIDGFGDGFKKGAASGFEKTANRMSEYYLRSAEQLYPIIEVNAKRHATFVLSEGKRFSFDKMILLKDQQASEIKQSGRL